MPSKKYKVRLSDDERAYIETLVKTGKEAAYKRLHGQILLLADEGDAGPGWKDEPISQACRVTGHYNQWNEKLLIDEQLFLLGAVKRAQLSVGDGFSQRERIPAQYVDVLML